MIKRVYIPDASRLCSNILNARAHHEPSKRDLRAETERLVHDYYSKTTKVKVFPTGKARNSDGLFRAAMMAKGTPLNRGIRPSGFGTNLSRWHKTTRPMTSAPKNASGWRRAK